MTVQEVKSMLNSVRVKYREYKLLEEKSEQFRTMISVPAPPKMSDAPKSEHNGNGMENKLIAAIWYENQANAAFRAYINARQSAEMFINSMKYPDEREILTRRYIMFQKWEVIADRLGVTPRWIYELHGKALVHIAETAPQNL